MTTMNSSSSPAAADRLVRVPVDRLHAHPSNANLMGEERLEKLSRNIDQQGRYPSLVARPHPKHPEEWQLIDGPQRLKALRLLGHTEVVVYCARATMRRRCSCSARSTVCRARMSRRSGPRCWRSAQP